MESNARRLNFRDFCWNYPKSIVNLIKITNPLFFILLAVGVGYLSFAIFTSDLAGKFVDGRDTTRVTEGVVGSLLSTNPMYVTENVVDRDFYALVFEKFIDINQDGLPVANIATSWEYDGDLRYEFNIRNDVFWHDGEKLTADDVVWNFDLAIKLATELGEDTYGTALLGVKVEKIGDYAVRFVLEEQNATFWEAVAVYLLPMHLYEDISLQEFAFTRNNTRPVGCGPYLVENITSKSITLKAFEYYWSDVNIQSYRYIFYEDYASLNSAVKNNEIDIINIYDLDGIENIENYPFYEINEAVLYKRKKMIYFNTRREKFSGKVLRQAISYLVDKDFLMEDSRIYGEPAKGPISEQSWVFNEDIDYYDYNPEKAKELLESLNYVRESDDDYYITSEDRKVISLELSYFQNDINERLVNSLVEAFRQEGILLRLKPLTFNQMTMEVLPTRDFELLLYEVEVTDDPDQYNLWHSLRIDHPMLNISGYDYSRVDILLERARTNTDRDERTEDYRLFQRYLMDDAPVIFLYHPKAFFVARRSLKGINVENIVYPSNKYSNVQDWYWEI